MLRTRKSIKTSRQLDAADKKSDSCPFCAIQADDIVAETSQMYVIKNRVAYDYFEGVPVLDHLMVIPKRHVKSLSEMTDAEKVDYVSTLGEFEKTDYGVYSRAANSAIRSVEHVHTHVLKIPGRRVGWQLYVEKPYLVLSGKQLK